MINRTRKPLFERLTTAMEEGIAHEHGALTLRTVEIPEAPPEIDGATVAALRQQVGMSQSVFARMLNVSPRTLQSWEQGVRSPSDASRRLLQIFSLSPEVVCQIAGLPEVHLEGVRVECDGRGRRVIVVRKPKRKGTITA